MAIAVGSVGSFPKPFVWIMAQYSNVTLPLLNSSASLAQEEKGAAVTSNPTFRSSTL
ncbi:hypothetical protein [Alkalihalobacillus deserti]|uniref:hypothetical protein n=1 Tax=Alkalihalobacillus deserti TaxID=2879466 RepID=UPI001D14351E|nr:hypothetical protein [Alkalihalobacillus deserti]